MIASAGVHGDEFEGIRAVHDVFAALDPSSLRGRFLGLPVCNPWALGSGTRCSPASVDGLNLARVFPGDQDGSPTEVLASLLLDVVTRNAGTNDLFVDLHSGGAKYAYLPMAGFRRLENDARTASEEAARHAGLGRIWAIDADPGPFNRETAARGIPSVGCEAGGQGALRSHSAAVYRKALTNLLRYAQVLAGRSPPRDAAAALRTTEVIAGSGALLRDELPLGARVTSGEIIAELVDELDHPVEQLRAPVDGELWAVRTFGSLDAGDIVCLIAHP